MTHNVCGMDKIIRAVVGIVMLLAGIYFGSWWGAIGVVPLVTAIIGYCPISQAFHVSSCPIWT